MKIELDIAELDAMLACIDHRQFDKPNPVLDALAERLGVARKGLAVRAVAKELRQLFWTGDGDDHLSTVVRKDQEIVDILNKHFPSGAANGNR